MKTILLVDDNPQNLYMLEVLLESRGYRVQKAANGKIGLEMAMANPPDMVISDILMPTMDGFTFCRAWKSTESLANIPFLFYTATYTDPKDETLALSLGAERFLVKPIDPEDFILIMNEVFARRGMTGPLQVPLETPVDGYYKTYSETLVRKLEEKLVELERANKILAALYQASCDLNTMKAADDMIKRVLSSIVDVAGYQQANFFLYDVHTKTLAITSAAGFSTETETTYHDRLLFKYGEETGLVGLVAKTGKSLNIGDVKSDPRWIVMDDTINSVLLIPVFFESNLLGVIALYSREKNAFDHEDEQNVSALTNSLAVAIENKRNQNHVQTQLKRLQALHNIDLAINANSDIRDTLNTITRHVYDQLDVDAVDVVLFNKFSLVYEYACGIGFLHRSNEMEDSRQRTLPAEKAVMHRRMVHIEGESGDGMPDGYIPLWRKEGFIEYWGLPLFSRGEVKGVLEIYKRSFYNPDLEWMSYLETMANQVAIAIDNSEMVEGLQRSNIDLRVAYDATIEGWSRALDLRDNETENHTLRVVETTLELASMMGINNEDLIHIKRGALLHDIGKMGVPDQILHKPGPLTDEEWAIMRRHPQFAYDMLSPIGYLHRALDIPSCHHEKWDGSGYPRGLKGEQIPFAARIFAVIDVWDALRSDRPYRNAWPEEKVLEYLMDQSGKHFDPDVVRMFLELLKKKQG